MDDLNRSHRALLAAIVVGALTGGSAVGLAGLAAPPSRLNATPLVELAPAVVGDYAVNVSVVRADPPRFLRDFRLTAFQDGNAFQKLDSLAAQTPGYSELRFADQDGDGALSSGDLFVVTRLLSGRFALQLSWRDQVVADASWTITPPTAVLGPPVLVQDDYWAQLDVTVASSPRLLSTYRVVYRRGGNFEEVPSLEEGTWGNLRFEDRDGNGRLTGGDRFTVYTDIPTQYELTLWWGYGYERIANASWLITPPQVSLSVSQAGPSTMWLNVTASDPAKALTGFVASIVNYGYWRDQIDWLPGGTSRYGMMSFEDRDGDGNLTAGDRFVVDVSPGNWELYLFWRTAIVAHVYF